MMIDVVILAIKTLLLDVLPAYTSEQIFQAYQNNNELPDKYIIITLREDKPDSLTPTENYDSAIEVMEISQQTVCNCFVDIYGVGAYADAKVFSTYLHSSLAHEFLWVNYEISVYEHTGVKNLSMELDRGKYIERAGVEFGLFRAITIDREVLGYSSQDIIVTLANKEYPQ
jgi:hypothetical protein